MNRCLKTYKNQLIISVLVFSLSYFLDNKFFAFQFFDVFYFNRDRMKIRWKVNLDRFMVSRRMQKNRIRINWKDITVGSFEYVIFFSSKVRCINKTRSKKREGKKTETSTTIRCLLSKKWKKNQSVAVFYFIFHKLLHVALFPVRLLIGLGSRYPYDVIIFDSW